MSIRLLFVVIVALLCGAGGNSRHLVVDAAEADALVALFNTLNGQHWTRRDGWNSTFTGHCNWFGVLCDSQGKVQSLTLNGNGLSGDLQDLNDQGIENDLSALTNLSLNGNALVGEVPLTLLLSFPKILAVDLTNNKLTDFPLTAGTALTSLFKSTTLVTLRLKGNRFWCPMPSYILPAAAAQGNYPFAGDLDLTAGSCIRTKTVTVFYTKTIQVDAPVPMSNLFDVNRTLEKFYVRSFLNVSWPSVRENISTLCTDILTGFAESAAGSSAVSGYTKPPYFDTVTMVEWKGVEWALLDFSKYPTASSQEQRVDLALRFRFGHKSVKSLSVRDFWWLYKGEVLSTLAPPATPPPDESVADNAHNRALLIAGIILLIIIILIAGIACLCRKKAYAPRPLHPPQFHSLAKPGEYPQQQRQVQSQGPLQAPPQQHPGQQAQGQQPGPPPPGFSGHQQQQVPPPVQGPPLGFNGGAPPGPPPLGQQPVPEPAPAYDPNAQMQQQPPSMPPTYDGQQHMGPGEDDNGGFAVGDGRRSRRRKQEEP